MKKFLIKEYGLIKISIFLGILWTFYVRNLYAQMIKFNQLTVRDELVVLGKLRTNEVLGLQQDTFTTKYIKADLVTSRIMKGTKLGRIDTLETKVMRSSGHAIEIEGNWLLREESGLIIRGEIWNYSAFHLPVGRKWGRDSVYVGVKKYYNWSTGFIFIDTLGVDTLFIWMNNTWVNIKP